MNSEHSLLIFDFTFVAIVLEFIVWANVLYKIIKFLKDYSKIESRLGRKALILKIKGGK